MLLIGPPGSGKTGRILDSLERAIRDGRSGEVQLLVPTASMKLHLVAVLARKGLMVPVRAVSTMPEFVKDLTPGVQQAHAAAEERLLRSAVRGTAGQAFGEHSASRGLRSRIHALMSEFWAAGADSYAVESAARRPGQRAFVTVFREYEDALAEQGYVHHNQRIAQAAARIRSEGLGTIRDVYVHGFDPLHPAAGGTAGGPGRAGRVDRGRAASRPAAIPAADTEACRAAASPRLRLRVGSRARVESPGRDSRDCPAGSRQRSSVPRARDHPPLAGEVRGLGQGGIRDAGNPVPALAPTSACGSRRGPALSPLAASCREGFPGRKRSRR